MELLMKESRKFQLESGSCWIFKYEKKCLF
jgi:hypothetical protein